MKADSPKMKLRTAQQSDMAAVHELVRELAFYEKALDEVSATIEDYERDGFGVQDLFKVLLAEDENGQLMGIAFYYYGYSTWKGKMLYLEDLVVREAYRRSGIGALLFEKIVSIAHQNHARQMRWQVIDWNEPAIKFYRKYEAELDPEWINGRINEAQLAKLSANAGT